MTRKDYELIARAIKDELDGVSPLNEGGKRVVYAVAAALAQDNPSFDRERFLKACGV